MDGSIINGIRQPPYIFVLNKPGGFEIISEPETIPFKKTNFSVMKNLTFL